MIRLRDLLKENSTSTYDYGCVMLEVDIHPYMEMVHNLIDADDVYIGDGDKTYGLEDETHVTLLYGIHDNKVNPVDIRKIINKYTFGYVRLLNPSVFKNKDYEVLKFDVKCEILSEVNNDLKKLPYTNDYPKYKPHMTIGYLKQKTADKYVKLLKSIDIEQYKFLPTKVTYSMPDKDRLDIKIKRSTVETT